MVQKIGPEELNVVFKFGGGLHTRASPDEIDGREAAGGQNFTLDIQNRNLTTRQPIDVIFAPGQGYGATLGGVSLLKTNGNVYTAFQLGSNVIQWFGGNSFTVTSFTANPLSKARGHWRRHVWNLSDVVLLTDLSLLGTVAQWDGTTFSFVSFVDENGNPFGNFYAKYLNVVNERAIFANVIQGANSLPHLIVGCKTSNFNQITVNNRPTSALGTGDPFFIPSPDLKPINGYINTYLGSMISTEKGEVSNLVGTDATNFAFNTFYANSAASGPESICEIGNDFIYGRQGRIESIRDTNTFGNSEAADLTAIISDQLINHNQWTIVYNGRTRKVYCFPQGFNEAWVMDAAIRDAGQISPWTKYTTQFPFIGPPTFAMSLLDPADGLEYIFIGDTGGGIYRIEGTGTAGDGGTATIDTQFLTKLVSARLDSQEYDYEGYIKYQRPMSATNVTLTFQYQGESIFNNSITVPLSTSAPASYYGVDYYGLAYFSSQSNKLVRNKFSIAGSANEFQLLIDIQSKTQVAINEIGIRMRAASQ